MTLAAALLARRHLCAISPLAGIRLVEALVAGLILAIGLLGLASLKTLALQFSRTAELRIEASDLALEITDAMRANLSQATGGGYDLASCTDRPTREDLAAAELSAWCVRLTRQLPAGQGRVTVAPSAEASVTVRWSDPHDPQCAAVGLEGLGGALAAAGGRACELFLQVHL